jgi:hypothetical protein
MAFFVINKNKIIKKDTCTLYYWYIDHITPIISLNNNFGARCLSELYFHPCTQYYYNDKFIIGDTYYIYNIKTIEKFNLKITGGYISEVCLRGHIDILEWWKKSKLPLEYSNDTLDFASHKKHFDILNWWLNSGLELKYTKWALDLASKNDDIDILNWWLNSGLPLKYTKIIPRKYSKDVYDWWVNSGLPLEFSTDPKYTIHEEEPETLFMIGY